MKSSTVNISFNDELLQKIDQIAKQEVEDNFHPEGTLPDEDISMKNERV